MFETGNHSQVQPERMIRRLVQHAARSSQYWQLVQLYSCTSTANNSSCSLLIQQVLLHMQQKPCIQILYLARYQYQIQYTMRRILVLQYCSTLSSQILYQYGTCMRRKRSRLASGAILVTFLLTFLLTFLKTVVSYHSIGIYLGIIVTTPLIIAIFRSIIGEA